MRIPTLIGVACIGAGAVLYAWWSVSVSPHVARVGTSIAFHQQQLKQQDATASLTIGSVEAAGFPLNAHVVVNDITLATQWGGERYSIVIDSIALSPVDEGEGRYNLQLPAKFMAIYQTAAGETRYLIIPDQMPAMLLRAQGDSRQCMNMPGTPRCADVAESAPLISYAVQLPARIVLDVKTDQGNRKIGFQFVPLNMPIFQTIPAQASRSIQLLLGMLEEAYRQ